MNKYFKKFCIMFVMSLAVIGAGMIQNGSVANAEVTVGKTQLKSPDIGWTRIDDADDGISYSENWETTKLNEYYHSTVHYTSSANNTLNFKFYGTKLRIIGDVYINKSSNISIKIDENVEKINEYNATFSQYQTIVYQKLNLPLTTHTVTITTNDSSNVVIDAIDIDESIKLDNSALALPVDNTQQLIATTTPAGAQVEWSSDNKDIATVDENGNVIGHVVGMATITAKIKGTDIKATCIVTVTPKGTEPTNPNPPVEPEGGENLFIELVDGQIKSYQVTARQIEDFKEWYLDRDNTKSNKPYFEFSKGSYKDYVVHDKIDWFEVR